MHFVEPKTLDRPRTYFKRGFTIVELLVVIAVIGILAFIALVSYSGIQQRAIAVSLQADLNGASKRLKLYQVDNEAYPLSVTDCPTPAAGNICLPHDIKNTYSSYNVDNTVSPQTFDLQIKNVSNDDIVYHVTNDSTPTLATVVPEEPVIYYWKKISSGNDYSCGILSNDQVYCWGENNNGQLGNNSTTNSSVPVPVVATGVLSGKTIVDIYCGFEVTLALDSAGRVYAWGDNAYGQLGDGSAVTESLVPVSVNTTGVLSGKTITKISIQRHALVLDSNGAVYTWGYNNVGQLGNNSTVTSFVPVAVTTSGVLSGKTITMISTGLDYNLVLASDGTAYSWGQDFQGQLGNNDSTRTNRSVPVAVYMSGVLSGKTISKIEAGYTHGIVIDSTGLVYTWGHNIYGQLGYGASNTSTASADYRKLAPIAVSTSGALSGKTIVAVAGGVYSTIAIDSTGKVYTWGYNNVGQLGDGSLTNSNYPIAVGSSGVLNGKFISSVNTGNYFMNALDSSGNLYSWGQNDKGQLNNNSLTDSSIPVSSGLPAGY